MIELRVLGEIRLLSATSVEIDALLRQPKRLALLAYVPSPCPGTWHRRDMLLALSWPELDTAHARTSLRDAICVLRQTLGDDVVRNRGAVRRDNERCERQHCYWPRFDMEHVELRIRDRELVGPGHSGCGGHRNHHGGERRKEWHRDSDCIRTVAGNYAGRGVRHSPEVNGKRYADHDYFQQPVERGD